MKYATAYVRMSDDRQDLSPAQQWEAIAERAKRDGYVLHPTLRYEDKGVSRYKRRARRPAYDRFKRDVKSGALLAAGVDRVYVWKATASCGGRSTSSSRS